MIRLYAEFSTAKSHLQFKTNGIHGSTCKSSKRLLGSEHMKIQDTTLVSSLPLAAAKGSLLVSIIALIIIL